jgi:hypothetical protein
MGGAKSDAAPSTVKNTFDDLCLDCFVCFHTTRVARNALDDDSSRLQLLPRAALSAMEGF